MRKSGCRSVRGSRGHERRERRRRLGLGRREREREREREGCRWGGDGRRRGVGNGRLTYYYKEVAAGKRQAPAELEGGVMEDRQWMRVEGMAGE